MEVIKTIKEMKEFSSQARRAGKTIAFVPTMGFFHDGHLSLMREGRRRCDLLIISLFVNPTQFGPNEDFKNYPRDFERDRKMAEEVGADVLFAPEASDMYPSNHQTIVRVEKVTQNLCGRSRPVHFQGVATVVLMLFEIVTPHAAIFGEKDYQQLVTIQQMVRDLHMRVEVVGMPTVREEDGLAMSSRNRYLLLEERKAALSLYRSLQKAKELLQKGERKAERILHEMKEIFQSEPLVKIDYVQICDAYSLQDVNQIEGDVVVALAAYLGKTRLIDNLIFHAL
ncbi:MAG: pantoate--beta-alanine ligase [Deltaproteobacteria bacterium CG03_land_8_20_14_0_80_45_14]|nr:MAG: pantoate--beta-alanine ligase [Deltaproteobacteria bacterium CG03_land_8_20_14_0_80_45_14]